MCKRLRGLIPNENSSLAIVLNVGSGTILCIEAYEYKPYALRLLSCFVPVDQRPRCLKISWALLLAPYWRIGKSKLVAIGLHGEADTSKKTIWRRIMDVFFC